MASLYSQKSSLGYTSGFGNSSTIDFNSLGENDEEMVRRRIDELRDNNLRLARENAMFMEYYRRHYTNVSTADFEPDPRARKQKKGVKRQDRSQMLTIEHRVEVAMRETEQQRGEIVRADRLGERTLDSLRALLDETEIRIAELKRETYEFKRDIVLGAVNHRTGKIIAERVLRYMEDQLKQKDALVEKMKLKNQMLAAQIKKVQQQLKEKEELGEGLSWIDFDQLKIENKQYFDKIHERNQELLKLKLTAGNTMQMLNTFKHKLQHLVSEAEWLRKEIAQRQDFLEKTMDQTVDVQADRDNAYHINTYLKDRIAGTKVPDVLEYVDQKAHLYELQKKVKDYARKQEIGEMELKRIRGLVTSETRLIGTASTTDKSRLVS